MNVKLTMDGMKKITKKLYIVSAEERIHYYGTLKVLSDELLAYAKNKYPDNKYISTNISELIGFYRLIAGLETDDGVPDEERLPEIYKIIRLLEGEHGFNLG